MPLCGYLGACPTDAYRNGGLEGGLGGLPSLLKEEENVEDDEEKMEEDEEEGIEGKRRDEEEMQDSLVVEEGKMVN